MEYHKIETLFNRNDKFVVTDELRNPVYASFKKWHVTEKIDGTNIRITLTEDGKVNYGGRTDNAQMDTGLLQYLLTTFTADKMQAAFWLPDSFGKPMPVKAILYGEGYGAGIQKGGGKYNAGKRFRLFDVLVDDRHWLSWEMVEDVARKLEIKTVPYLGEWTLDEIVENVKGGIDRIPSVVAMEETGERIGMEGVIGRTIEPLFDRRGKRIILKLKTSDFGKATA